MKFTHPNRPLECRNGEPISSPRALMPTATDPSPSIDMRHLRLVSAISSCGTVSAAARELGLTQPALSHQLRELETRLRTPLFIRTAKAMVPTPAGEQLASIARGVVGQV